jgi:co-chaperonin GroES (HSP10)
MKAIGKFILIHEIKEQQITESGILLTADDTNQQRYKKGSVIIPGTDVDTVSKGDVIYYDRSSGHSMMLYDDMVTVITERDVVVVL